MEELEYFLGVLDDVKKYAFEVPNGHKYDSLDSYKLVGTMKMVQDFEPTPAYPFVRWILPSIRFESEHISFQTRPFTIAQYQHEAVLREHIERLGAKVELGTRATTIEQDESGVMGRYSEGNRRDGG